MTGRSARLTTRLRNQVCLLFTGLILTTPGWSAARADDQAPTIDRLMGMSVPELETLYRQGLVAGLPAGKVRGTAILAPGTRRNRRMAAGTRLVWQGKVIEPEKAMAVNRFFGFRVIRGQLAQAPSWLDGGPSLVLDYSQTSLIYANYRDEIRQVAPGLFLGLMYDRTTAPPNVRMYFVLETQP